MLPMDAGAEYRTAEDRGKPIFPARLEPTSGRDITSEWQRCDLFGDGPKTVVPIDGRTGAVEFLTEGLVRLQKGLRAIGIAPDTFLWPPEGRARSFAVSRVATAGSGGRGRLLWTRCRRSTGR